jgi:DnaJ family protein C protein 10
MYFRKRFEVEKLTDQSFYQKVVGRDEGEIWFIDFAANWCRPCQNMLPEFKEAAKSLRGRVNFGYVECTQYQGICQGFGIESYPSLFLFPAKTTNNIDPDLVKFNYQRRDSYAFFHFLSNNIKTKQPVADARMIVDFDKYIQQQDKPILIDFFASWCGPCQEFMPIFQFANALMDDVLFIKVDCETGKGKSICQKFKIRQYPTVILYQKDQSMKSGYRKTEIDTDFNLNELLSSVEAKIIKRQNKKNDSAHDEL